MQREETKQRLWLAAKELLLQSQAGEEITSRQIAAKAGLNPAMINYYFRSKDDLLTAVIGELIGESAEELRLTGGAGEKAPAIDRLWDIIWRLCEMVLKFERFTKVYVPHLLLQSEIDTPLYLLPLLHEIHPEKSETECRLIAYQFLSFLQLVFYRAEAFRKYTGIDLSREENRRALLKMEFQLFFHKEFDR